MSVFDWYMANRITRLREALGITQEEMARLLEVSRSHLAMMETGKAAPSGLADTYLIQAERICFLAQQEWENQPKASLQVKEELLHRKIQKLEINRMQLSREIERLEARYQTSMTLKFFLKRLKVEFETTNRNQERLLEILEAKTSDEDIRLIELDIFLKKTELAHVNQSIAAWLNLPKF